MYERQRTFEPYGTLFAIWYSKNDKPGGWAWSRFHNDELDATLLKTQEVSSEQELQRLWTQVQRIVTENALALPTVDDAAYYVMRKNVKGFKLGAIGNWFFANDMYVEK
jgi:ABC-type transport system substrate-binding protein